MADFWGLETLLLLHHFLSSSNSSRAAITITITTMQQQIPQRLSPAVEVVVYNIQLISI